jgi:uncharacterized protein
MTECNCMIDEKKETIITTVFKRIDKVYITVAVIFAVIAFLDFNQFLPLANLTLENLAATAPYIVFAIMLIAVLKASGAETIVSSAFNGRENRMIIFAALLGGLAPFCSCEVIPFIAGLLALGTPLAPIMAFWLSSPLIDPPTLMITAGALGWKFAIAKAVVAVTIGLMGGFVIKIFQSAGYFKNPLKPHKVASCGTRDDDNSCSDKGCGDTTGLSDRKPVWYFWSETMRMNVFRTELKNNTLFLLKWMLFAYTLESLMIHYIPAETISSVVGGKGLLPIILSAFVGIPAYLNSYIAPPIVAGLMKQGMSAGSGMAFIVAGAISSIPAMTAVYALVRRQVFIAYALFGFTGAVLAGLTYEIVLKITF